MSRHRPGPKARLAGSPSDRPRPDCLGPRRVSRRKLAGRSRPARRTVRRPAPPTSTVHWLCGRQCVRPAARTPAQMPATPSMGARHTSSSPGMRRSRAARSPPNRQALCASRANPRGAHAPIRRGHPSAQPPCGAAGGTEWPPAAERSPPRKSRVSMAAGTATSAGRGRTAGGRRRTGSRGCSG